MSANHTSSARSDHRPQSSEKEFNRAGGAEAQASTPRVSKAAVMSEIKKMLKPAAPGGTVVTLDGEELTPSPEHKNMMKEITGKDITLVEGKFGSGKNIWTARVALEMLVSKQCNKIAITAPAVEAGENIGFLPGAKDEKMNPYVNQILETFDEFVGKNVREQMVQSGLVEIAPHAFMRGRTFKKTFFIIDECQNASGPNLMTALQRIGNDSKFVFLGDNNQNDRTSKDSAYSSFVARFTAPGYEDAIGYARLTKVFRHPLLQRIVERGDDRALEGHEGHKEQKTATPPAHTPQKTYRSGPGLLPQ